MRFLAFLLAATLTALPAFAQAHPEFFARLS